MEFLHSKNSYYKIYEIGFGFYTNCEWFVLKNISISAEYGFEYIYQETEIESRFLGVDELIDESSLKEDRKLFQSLPVSLGVSIYF